jgi:membrane protease YdiL (CAAX protease family)
MKKALLYLFTFLATEYVAIFLVIGAYMLFAKGDPSEELPPLWNIVTMVAYSLAVVVVFLSMGWFKVSRSYLQSHPWGVVTWSVIAALGAIVPSMVLQGLLPEWTGWAKDMAEETSEQLAGLMRVPGGYMVVALLPPLVEEMVFRGCILKSLLQWKPQKQWLMIALSALIFALVHLNPAQMPHTFLIGLLLGWMYVRTGSIVPGVVFHWTNNTIAFVLLRLYPDPDLHLIDILGNNRNIGAAIIFSLFILAPALYQLWLRMERK